MPSWRNWTARGTPNPEVAGSIPAEGFSFYILLQHSRCIVSLCLGMDTFSRIGTYKLTHAQNVNRRKAGETLLGVCEMPCRDECVIYNRGQVHGRCENDLTEGCGGETLWITHRVVQEGVEYAGQRCHVHRILLAIVDAYLDGITLGLVG